MNNHLYTDSDEGSKTNLLKGKEEICHLQKLKSPYIVDYNTSWMESENCLCIQMEFCEYNLKCIINLKNLFKESLDAIEFYISCESFREVLQCVKYLHSLDPPIIHRDLKPENILVSHIKSKGKYDNRRYVKLCDLGFSC